MKINLFIIKSKAILIQVSVTLAKSLESDTVLIIEVILCDVLCCKYTLCCAAVGLGLFEFSNYDDCEKTNL